MKRVKASDLREFEQNKPASLYKKILRGLGRFLIVLLFFLGLLCIMISRWYERYYSDVSFGQLLYHLYAPLEGTNAGFMDSFATKCIPIPAVCTLIFVIVYFVKSKLFKRKVSTFISILFFIGSVALFGYGFYDLMTSMHIQSYIESVTTISNIYEDKYVDPKKVEFKFPEKKRNLIYILCESMETTYESTKDGGLTREDYIPELTKLQNENDTFNGGDPKYNGYYVPASSSWTMAGIVGQTSGTPLTVDPSLSNEIKEGDFLPNATSIGEILGQAGYFNEFMCGSDIAFGGRENYLSQHGYDKFFDLNYAHENGYLDPNYAVWWGYEDAKLFDFAKSELEDLSSGEKPFNFTVLTVDTHFPNGYTCQDCEYEFDENYSNVMRCSSKRINEFVDWCKEQDWYANTTIVIAGDHKTMDTNWFQNKDTTGYNRKAYYTILNSAVKAERSDARELCTYDLFPTTLASLGVKFNSDRLGFGTNLYGPADTLVEEIGFIEFNDKISARSDYYINYLFGGRDVSKPEVKEDEKVDLDPILPEFFEGDYDYSTGTTTNNGQQIGGGNQHYGGTQQPSNPPQTPGPSEGNEEPGTNDPPSETPTKPGGGEQPSNPGGGEQPSNPEPSTPVNPDPPVVTPTPEPVVPGPSADPIIAPASEE
ncbi:MAG: sulfatase-like hydrolase/transferase [Firmicutes bacterium]|nr:sulfatase-like hydrolase/transferase [Bacillota bacterium]